MIGAAWATLFLVWTGRTVWCFVPFIAVALLVLVVLLTCLRNRLLPHAYFCIKKQESLLKRHLLERKNAEGFHHRRYGQEPAVPNYYESLDSAELFYPENPYPICISNDANLQQQHSQIIQRLSMNRSRGPRSGA